MAQIKKDTSLRKAILQAAITGQLISTCHSELDSESAETGKELLDRIIEERNKKLLNEWEEALKKNPKTKKPAPIVPCEIAEEEIPFEIPENWCWVKGKNIFAPMESIKPQGETFTYIDTDAVNNKSNIIDNPKTLLVKEAPSRASRKLHKGDVLFSMVRPYLKNIAFVEDNFSDAIASTGFYVMTQIGMYNPRFLYYMVLSPYVIDGLHYFMKGDNSPSINTTDVDNFVYPLPPLAVQNAIVEKLEQVLPLVDAYENALLQKEELKTALPDKVKKAILQEAITGQLTEAWRKSATIKESGKQLLDRIIEERNAKALSEWEEALKKNPKAKKPVPVVASEIEDDEIPFEVPESWCWCRLGDVIDLLSGRDLEPSAYNSISKGIPYMTGASNFDNEELIVNRWTDKPATISNLGDLLITCKGTIGELAFNNVGNVHIARQIMAIRKTEYINLRFLNE